MEYHYGTKCVPQLPRITSSGSSSTNAPSFRSRRTNSTTGDFPARCENSWSRASAAPSTLSFPRRQTIYGYPHHQRVWIPRHENNKIVASNGPLVKMPDECVDKSSSATIITHPILQHQMSTEKNPAATVELKQARLEQRTESLLRRLRALQFSQSCCYVENELNSIANSLRRALDNASVYRETETLNDVRALVNDPSMEQKLENLIKTGEFNPKTFSCEELRSATPTTIAHLIRKYEPSLKQILALCTSPASFPSSSVPASNWTVPSNVSLDVDDRQYLNRVTQSLKSHLSGLQRDYDSDATESSSGGESCDECEKDVEKNDVKQLGKIRHSKLENRASWQWWTERSSLGSRWTWIQFQLADLEYKIRQHIDLHKQLRCRKMRRTNSETVLTRTSRNCTTGSNLSSESSEIIGRKTSEDDSSQSLEGCARTRPVDCLPRRRIIRTAGMHRWNRKIFSHSSIQCGCFPPYSPCVNCGGRNDAKDTSNPQSQRKNLRNAVLEPTYHPVLSTGRGKGVGLDRMLQSHWCAPKPPIRSSAQLLPMPRTIVTLLPGCRSNEGSSTKASPSSETPVTEQPRRGRKVGSILSKRRHSAAVTRRNLSTLKRAKLRRTWSRSYSTTAATGSGNLASSSIPFELETEAGKLGSRRATDKQSTFDIDNIVIDPKVAAVSRVEKIQYKEILTPGWRILDLPERQVVRNGELSTSEDEDIADTAFTIRHDVKENEEKKRFIPILFRDLHSAARRAQLLSGQSISTESNGSIVTTPLLPTPTIALPSPIISNSPNYEKSSDNGTSMELSYDPFPPRNFPLNDTELTELVCVDNDTTSKCILQCIANDYGQQPHAPI